MSESDCRGPDPLGVLRPGERFIVHVPLRAGGGFAHAARTGHQIAVTLSTELSTLIDADDIGLSREHGDGSQLRIYAHPVTSIAETQREWRARQAEPTVLRRFGKGAKQ